MFWPTTLFLNIVSSAHTIFKTELDENIRPPFESCESCKHWIGWLLEVNEGHQYQAKAQLYSLHTVSLSAESIQWIEEYSTAHYLSRCLDRPAHVESMLFPAIIMSGSSVGGLPESGTTWDCFHEKSSKPLHSPKASAKWVVSSIWWLSYVLMINLCNVNLNDIKASKYVYFISAKLKKSSKTLKSTSYLFTLPYKL